MCAYMHVCVCMYVHVAFHVLVCSHCSHHRRCQVFVLMELAIQTARVLPRAASQHLLIMRL